MINSRKIDFRFAPNHAQVCIGLVDDPYKSIVYEDGSLNWGYSPRNNPTNHYYIYEDNYAVMTPEQCNRGFTWRLKPQILHHDQLISVKQNFGDPAAAIVTTTEDYKASVLEWTIFAWLTPNHARVDVILWTLKTKENFITTRSGVSLKILGRTDGLAPILHSPRYKTVKASTEELPFMAPGEEMRGAYFVVQSGDLLAPSATLEMAENALKWAQEYWSEIHPFLKIFNIPDPQIDAMLKACGRNILQAREEKNGVYTYQVGPTQYRGLWIVDGHFLLEAAHMMGRTEEAFAGLLAVLRHVRPDGSIMVMNYHQKETGIAIATICRQCELTNNDARLRELWPTMQRALRYIRSQRAESYTLGEDYPARGMFAPTFGDGGINGPEPEYTTPVWVLAGLKAAYLAGKRLDLEDYQEFGDEFDDLLAVLRKCIARDHRTTADGMPYFPQSMIDDPWCKKADFSAWDKKLLSKLPYKPQTGTWALAQAIYPGEVFSPEDPVVQELLQLLDSVDDTEGIPENTGWETHNALWGYSAMFYGEDWLYANHPEKAVDYLYAFANHASPGRVWREEQALHGTQSEEMCGDMPHNWGSAEFIRLTRNLLVMERQGSLEILAGLPAEWLPTNDCALELEQTPTKYGRVSIKLSKEEGKYELMYFRDAFSQTPERQVLHWPGKIIIDGKIYEKKAIIPGDKLSFKADCYL